MDIEKDIIRQHDKMAHASSISVGMFTAFLLLTLIPALSFWMNLLIVDITAITFAYLWEYRDFKLKQNDFGSRKDEVSYEWADFRAFVYGIAFTNLILLITKS